MAVPRLVFVAGVMNPLWIALITAFVLAEKIAPGPKWITRGRRGEGTVGRVAAGGGQRRVGFPGLTRR